MSGKYFFTNRSEAKNISLIIGIACYVLAILNIANVISPSTTGRWAWLWNNLSDLFGVYGYPLFLFGIGTLLVIIARVKK